MPYNDREWAQDREALRSLAKGLCYHRVVFIAKPSLVSHQPNAEGWYAVLPYDYQPYDSAIYHIEPGTWDHEHCFICAIPIRHGMHWWAAEPPNEIGLCEECFSSLFGNQGEEGKTGDRSLR